MTPEFFLEIAVYTNLGLILFGFLVLIYRIFMGPSLPDRILSLDLLVAFGVGLILTLAVWSGYGLYIDVALALGLVGFLATVAFARFILRRGGGVMSGEDDLNKDIDGENGR